MTGRFPVVQLAEVLVPVSRPQPVDPDKTYRILGAHWYARGLYVKDVRRGSEIRADRVYRVEEGDFVYNRLFAWKGSFAIVNEEHRDCYVSNEFPCFTVKKDRAHAGYLWRYFSRAAAWNEALGLSTGGTPTSRNRLKEEKLLAMKIPLPPLGEQRRIVARIDGLAAKIGEAQDLRQQALREADEIGTRMAAGVFDKGAWPHQAIRELIGTVGLKNGKSFRTVGQPSDVRCLMLSALRNGRINCADTKPVPVTKEEVAPYLVRRGDIFVLRGSGSKELVGRAGIVETVPDGVIFPDLFIRVPIDQEKVLGRFLVALWNSTPIRRIIEDSAKTTSGIWKINQGHITSTAIPVPPLPEQRRVVACLDGLQARAGALKRLQAETAAELDALLPSILDKALRGEL